MRQVFLARTLIDGRGDAPLSEAAIAVEDGRISFVRPRAELPRRNAPDLVVDTGSCTLMPGLIDLHCHSFLMGGTGHVVPGTQDSHVAQIVRGLRNAAAWLDQGVTTTRQLGCMANLDIQ